MKKIYKATNFYYFKICITILLIALACLLYIFFFSALGFGFLINTIVAGIFIIISLFIIYVVIISNKPVIIIEKDTLTYRYKKLPFSEIEAFHISRGGSEPYILTKEGKRIDLELSWLKKQDQLEIEETLQDRLKNG
ncbi:hypothetical protein GTQ40_13355 [Flavobacteriaceae bacterium R38]|nr:hypothetical protein [Flavobacteriaceae bacterium R38]